MPRRQISIATIAFTIVVLSLNFALIRGIVTVNALDERVAFALLFLAASWNVLLVAGYRLAWRRNRSAPAWTFFGVLLALSIAESLCLIFLQDRCIALLRSILRPVFTTVLNAAARVFGNGNLRSPAGGFILGIVFEFLLPMAFFSVPTLLPAWLAGRFVRRMKSLPAQQVAATA